ncbi:MAG: hypothetical protein AB7E47_10525 [Desulfovibrionaceae bacterium]
MQEIIAGTGIDVEIGANATSADLADQIWLADRGIIEKVQVDQFFMNAMSLPFVKSTHHPDEPQNGAQRVPFALQYGGRCHSERKRTNAALRRLRRLAPLPAGPSL